MADSRVQLIVEEWIRTEWLPERFGQQFTKRDVHLTSGGSFEFDAVSSDGGTLASISTSGATTARGRNAAGKIQKLRADMYFLLLAEGSQRLLVLSERDMFERMHSEKDRGRVSPDISVVHAVLPPELRTQLQASRDIASREVSPGI